MNIEVVKYIESIEDPSKDLLEILLVVKGQYPSLSKDILEEISKVTGVPLEEIEDTIDFFPFLSQKKSVEVCGGPSCSSRGSDEIIAYLEEKNIPYQVTPCRRMCQRGPIVKCGVDYINSFEDLEKLTF